MHGTSFCRCPSHVLHPVCRNVAMTTRASLVSHRMHALHDAGSSRYPGSFSLGCSPALDSRLEAASCGQKLEIMPLDLKQDSGALSAASWLPPAIFQSQADSLGGFTTGSAPTATHRPRRLSIKVSHSCLIKGRLIIRPPCSPVRACFDSQSLHCCAKPYALPEIVFLHCNSAECSSPVSCGQGLCRSMLTRQQVPALVA